MIQDMSTTYGYTKQVESNHQGSKHTLAILMSMLRVSLEAAWKQPRCCLERYCTGGQSPCAILVRCLRTASSQPMNCQFAAYGLFRILLLLFVLLGTGIGSVWGQTKVSDGIYYIRNNGTNQGYLWPSVTTNATSGYRYLTTSLDTSALAVTNNNGVSYLAHDKSYSHWVVKNVTGGYIQLINPRLNKYVVLRSFPKANNTKENSYGDRDVWLTDEPAAEDVEYSYFVLNNNNSPYKISPKPGLNDVATTSGYSFNSASGDDRVWLTWSKSDNKPQNEEGREGLIQLFSGGTPLWSFTPDLLDAPTIEYDSENDKFIISYDKMPAGFKILYTIDGSDPSSTVGGSTMEYTNESAITLATIGENPLKAVVVRYGLILTETAILRKPTNPTITQTPGDCNNTVTISAGEGTSIYYTIDGTTPTNSSTLYTVPFVLNSDATIKAVAYSGNLHSEVISFDYTPNYSNKPSITQNGATITITGSGTIYYTTNGSDPDTGSTLYDGPFTLSGNSGDLITVKAVAKNGDKELSCVVEKTVTMGYFISNLSQLEAVSSHPGDLCILAADINASGFSSSISNFTGVFDGGYHTISGLSKPLFDNLNGGTVKNVVFDPNTTVSGNGAICNEADGATKIYNCGVLSGTVSGSGNVGALVGHIKSGSSVRVVNCYSYANVSGSDCAAGIVGKNDGTVGDVRIAMCMMYGTVSGATTISPVYAGNHTSNAQNYTEYNYYLYSTQKDALGQRIIRIPYTKASGTTPSAYNDQLAIDKEEYLTRFPFYRHILNTHRELAAYFLFGDYSEEHVNEIGHWAVKKGDNAHKYPIVESWVKNKTNTTPTETNNDLPNTTADYAGKLLTTMGISGYLSVSIKIGGNNYSAKLPITDMDTLRNDYTYGKVILPFANEYKVNTDYSKICTGWKITGVSGGTAGTFENYNFADRDCTAKDIYNENTNPFIYAQGGYYIVPTGVKGITIEANFAEAVYLSDATYEIGYNSSYGGRTGVGDNISGFHGQTVYNSLKDAVDALSTATTNPHKQAIVLVGNYHYDLAKGDLATTSGFTLMSIDADNNQEPDYGFYSIAPDRPQTPALRFDFVPIIPLGMAAKVNGSNYYPGIPIWNSRGWYEQTETAVSIMNQFELDSGNFTKDEKDYEGKGQNPCIINGGYFVQMIRSRNTNCSKVSYFKIGGNAYIKEFYPGSHSSNAKNTTIVPVNVTGGQVDECYMTGYKSGAKAIGTDIRFWCSGGKIGKFLGAYMDEPWATSEAKGNVNMTAQVDHALIGRFFGGGTSPNATITGDINVTINNSKVDFYCGGPEFGDMSEGKKVETNATNTTFGEYYGAGFGGTAITYNPVDYTPQIGPSVTFPSSRYTYGTNRLTNSGTLGLATCYKFEYLMHSAQKTQLVARFITGYANFNLATTGDVTNNLTGCTVERDFYGAGCQGKVNGTVTSTLTSCELKGNAFGGGFKAVSNEVKVYPAAAPTLSVYNGETGLFSEFGTMTPVTFTWEQGTGANPVADEDHLKLKTSNGVTMTELGNVTKAISLTIDGGSVVGAVFGGGNESKSLDNTTVVIQNGTTIGRSVYGGGNLADVNGNTSVTVTGGTIGTTGKGGAEYGNVYGGGKGKADDVTAGIVKGSTNVSISGSPAILHNVYGGGAYGSVGTFSYDATTGFPTDWTTTDNKGKCTVSIMGGTIGTTGDNNGMVFGSSRGLEGNPSNPNVDKMAWVYDTDVTIGTQSSETGPSIKGSVYGGGENGHNFHDAKVTVHSGTIGILEGAEIIDDRGTPGDTSDDISYTGARFPNRGNVYGSGCGTDTYTGTDSKTYFDFNAGIVRGNTTVLIDGGHVVHNVYGGGAMGSVGTYTFDVNGKPISCADETGTCTVTVSGGQIGVTGAKMAGYGKGGPDDYGHVFGAGRGEMHDPDQYPNMETCAFFNKTILNITGTAFLTGSVYGGSESGHVLGDTEVNISGGQIGCGKNTDEPFADAVWADDYTPTGSVTESMDCASWPFTAPFAPYDPFANATGDLDKYPNGRSTDGGRLEASDGHTYYGNVFGGGSGCIPYFDTTEGISKYLSTAGSVEGKTTINITGGHILTNVYGGCEATNVKGSATITMTGGTVGVPRTVAQIVAHPNTGYIFGAGKGDQRIFFNKETNVDRTAVTIEGGRVYGSIFGGGEDGHVFQNAIVNIGKDGEAGPTIGTSGTSYVDGNVFGGGRGFGGEALTAGNIGGSIELNIKSGKILGSVYGGGRLGSVGYGLYLVDEEIIEDGQTIKPYGILRPNDKYDGSYPNPSTQDASAYYDKGRGYITINISGGTIGNDYEYIYNPTDEQKAKIPNTTFDYQNHLQYTKGGNVFTGGMGRLYALDNTTLLPLWPKLGKCKGTTLKMTGGTVKSSIYGGGEIGAVAENATVNVNGGTVGTKVVDPNDATKYYYFGSVFGGGKGSTANVEGISEAGTTGGNVEVNLNKTVASNDDAKGAIVSQVFGCNDMNGSPKGTVTVHVYATQNADKANISTKGTDTYDVMAVYGGGNLAAYEPTDLSTGKAKVIIDGCGLTSVRQVYGGGNAASTPATDVEINGTYEIMELFGGGNGADKLPSGADNPGANVGYKDYHLVENDPAYDTKEERLSDAFEAYRYGTGVATVNIKGGTIHRVFGGSNTKGNVRQTALTLLEEVKGTGGAAVCPFHVDEAYGGGKSAPMDAEAQLHMACIPGLQEAYGGAEAADIHDNVTLTITNGTFNRVFGGNNISGTISGKITVNVEETGCRPVVIGELYGGGNLAAYSKYGYNDDGTPKESGENPFDDPEVNVRSFTSIGAVYGGGYGTGAKMIASPTVNINESLGTPDTYPTTGDYDANGFKGKTITLDAGKETEHTVTLPAHTKGKMGAIGDVFGGGNAAEVKGNTKVNIGTLSENTFVSLDDNPATTETDESKKPVLGADIRGNVYGGGNNAEVTGDTNVTIGKKNE